VEAKGRILKISSFPEGLLANQQTLIALASNFNDASVPPNLGGSYTGILNQLHLIPQ
jgi:hypothetical protein